MKKIDWLKYIPLCISLFILFLGIRYWNALTGLVSLLVSAAWPLVLGAAIAYVINILMSFYERNIAPRSKNKLWQKSRRTVCMLLAFLTVIAAAALLAWLIIPQLTNCFAVLLNALPPAVEGLSVWAKETFNFDVNAFLQEHSASLPSTIDDWRALLEQHADKLINGVGGVMSAVVSATSVVFSSIITIFMSLIFCINILAGKEKLGQQFRKLSLRVLGEKIMKHVSHVLSTLNDCFHAYIVGQLVEAVILGTMCAVGMWIFGFPYPLMIGAVIGVLALIPIAGAYIGGAVGFIMIFSVSPTQAVLFLVFLVVLQQIEGNLIYPRTVGSTLHLPGIWVLAAVLIGGGVMGVVGMILFVPLTAAIYRLTGEWVAAGKAARMTAASAEATANQQ